MFELFRRRLNAAKQAGADVIEINEEYLLAGAAALLDRCWIEDR